MIRHVVLFTLTSAANLEAARAGLERLAQIPHVRALEVATNLKRDRIDSSVDLVLHAVFDSVEALEAYHAHPLYQEATGLVRPLRDLRMAADFVTTV